MSTQTQKALLVTEVGKPLVLVNDRPVPQPGPSQIQVRITVAGLNPHDQKGRDWGLFTGNSLPAILAADVTGKVNAVGSEVTRFSVGDRVVGQGGLDPTWTQAGLQEFAVLDEDFVAKIPDGVTDDEAATLPINLVTSMLAIFDEKALAIPAPWTSAASSFDYAGTTILVVGGGSNCGKLGVQLAGLAGIGRIIVIGGDEAELKAYGATHVIDRHVGPEEIVRRIREIVDDDLVYAYDAINPPASQVLAINALSSTKKGKLARLLIRGPVDESKIQPKKNGYELLNIFGSAHASPAINKVFWARLPQYLIDGKIKPTKFEVVQGLDADSVNEVLDRYRDGKKVLKPHVHVS